MKYEYQTLELPLSFGIAKATLPDIAGALNAPGLEGWYLKQAVFPAPPMGSSDRILLILERVIG